jgi:hypothetical protein
MAGISRSGGNGAATQQQILEAKSEKNHRCVTAAPCLLRETLS